MKTKQVRIRLVQDTDTSSPRKGKEWDNMGTMVCWNRRYDLGDEQPAIDPNEYLASIPKGSIILPLYLYDHSGITISCGSFSCPWDSGQVGFIYVAPETIRKEYSTNGKKSRERAESVLRSEVATYAQYLEGDVWGFVLEEGEECDHGDMHWTEIDSCWGFYGHDPFENGISEHIPEQYHEALRKASRD